MRNLAKRCVNTGIFTLILTLLATQLLSGNFSSALASDKTEAQSLVDKSKGTITDLAHDDNFSWMHRYLKSAKAVLIFPQILKAGFFLGGSGGTGVLLVRNESSGTWSEPAFYTLGSVTFGFQFGGEAAEVVMLALNQKAIDSLLSSSVKLGGDASIAIGPIGGGAKGSVTIPEVKADFVSFAKTKGFYGGLNFEGSVLQVRDVLNSSYYGRTVLPKDILIKNAVNAPGSQELRSALGNMTR